jgi:hypothetical protein
MVNRPPHPGSPTASAPRSLWPVPRLWAVALITFRQAVRAKLWILLPPAVLVLILADLSSQRFDPVFETVPAAVSLALMVMTVMAVILALFFATFSIPTELESKVSYSVLTKPLARVEYVAGKTLGMSLVILAATGLIGASSYIFIYARSAGVHDLAQRRLDEATPRAAFPSDLNGLRSAADQGPLQTYQYLAVNASPTLGVDLGETAAASPNLPWILGETGVRLIWRLPGAAVRPVVASGSARFHLALKVAQPEGSPPVPTQVLVALVPIGATFTREGAIQGMESLVFRTTVNLPPSGELDIPLLPPGVQPPPGALNAAPGDELVLNLAVQTGGHAIGAGPGALQLIGPNGKAVDLKLSPEVMQSAQARRVALAGRTQAPRQFAAFHFTDVPGEAFGSDDAVLEAAFSMDTWAPANVPPVGEAVLIRPDGQRRVIKFTPDSHRSTYLHIDKTFWHGGSLEVRLTCQTDEDYMNLLPESVRFRVSGGPYLLNFIKACLRVWLFGTVLAALGVALSTRLTWFVAILGTVALFLVSLSRGIILTFLETLPFSTKVQAAHDVVARVPDIRSLLPDTAVSMGQVMPMSDLLTDGAVAMAAVLVFILVGWLLLKFREVAA